MKEFNNIDELFKEGLGSFEVAPSEQVWEHIEGTVFPAAAVPFYKKRWVIAALLLLLITVGGWFLFFNTNTPANDVKIVKSKHIQPRQNASSPVTAATGDEKENQVVSNNELTESKSPEQKLETENFHNAQSPIPTENRIATTEQNIVQSGSNVEKRYNEPAVLPSRSIYTLAILPQNKNMKQPQDIITVEQYVKKRSNLHIYTGATAEAGMIYYPATEDQFTWAANAAVGLKAGKFYFESGIGYRYIQERGSYKIDFKTQDSVGYYNHVTSFEINPQNPDQIILNYKKTTVFDSVNHIAYTAPLFKYDYLTVPVRVGYRFINRGNWFVAAETGIEYNHLMRSFIPEDGFYYEGADDVHIINETSERAVNNLKYMLSLRIGIKLNKNITVMLQPEFSRYLTSIYNTNKGYDNIKPYMMNLRAGIYFDF